MPAEPDWLTWCFRDTAEGSSADSQRTPIIGVQTGVMRRMLFGQPPARLTRSLSMCSALAVAVPRADPREDDGRRGRSSFAR